MKILCLHGMGVNADIFAAQTAPFRRLLPSDYEFVFHDGCEECEPPTAISNVYPGPYRCWYNTPTTAKLSRAYRHVQECIEKQGPFDGVMGFSQGAALAASMLLSQADCTPSPFRFAIFICSPLPFSASLAHGIDTRSYFGSPAPMPARPDCPTKVPAHLITDPVYLRGEERLEDHAANSDAGVSSGFAKAAVGSNYQMFHATVDKMRIQVPTGHIVGAKDEWRLHSLDVVKLCDPRVSAVLEHHGGHAIPRGVEEEICDLIEGVVASSAQTME